MSTDDKTERVWMEEIGPILVEVLATVALAAISGGAALGVRVAMLAKAGKTVNNIKKVARSVQQVDGVHDSRGCQGY